MFNRFQNPFQLREKILVNHMTTDSDCIHRQLVSLVKELLLVM